MSCTPPLAPPPSLGASTSPSFRLGRDRLGSERDESTQINACDTRACRFWRDAMPWRAKTKRTGRRFGERCLCCFATTYDAAVREIVKLLVESASGGSELSTLYFTRLHVLCWGCCSVVSRKLCHAVFYAVSSIRFVTQMQCKFLRKIANMDATVQLCNEDETLFEMME